MDYGWGSCVETGSRWCSATLRKQLLCPWCPRCHSHSSRRVCHSSSATGSSTTLASNGLGASVQHRINLIKGAGRG